MPRSSSCSMRHKRERRLARARAAEHRGVALQHVAIERDRLGARAGLAAGDDARAVAAAFVEDDGQRQLVVVGGRRLGGGAVGPGAREGRAGDLRLRGFWLGGHAALATFIDLGHRLRDRRLRQRAAEEIEAQQLDDRDQVRQQLGVFEPGCEARIVAMMGVELAHGDHALPLGDRHQDLAAAGVAELAEGLRRLVLLVRREVGRAQHEAALAGHRRQHLVELALQAAALGRAVAEKHAAVADQPGFVRDADVDGRQIVGDLEPVDGELDRAVPLVLGEAQRRRQHVHQLVVVGGHLGFGRALEALPHVAVVDGGQ